MSRRTGAQVELKIGADPDSRVETKNRPSLLTIADVIDNLRLIGAANRPNPLQKSAMEGRRNSVYSVRRHLGEGGVTYSLQ